MTLRLLPLIYYRTRPPQSPRHAQPPDNAARQQKHPPLVPMGIEAPHNIQLGATANVTRAPRRAAQIGG